ncbi:MAG: tetratricopeptide repeat protein, partial [Ktedonobacteraceae bacterium]|nr:tetratricopeptide repeat protein [Ktedonobacteraceae bacterium]
MSDSALPLDLDTIRKQYSTGISTLCEIANSSFYLGQQDKALHIMSVGIQLLEDEDVAPRDQAKLLLCYGGLLTKNSFYAGKPMEEAFTLLTRACHIAESLQETHLLANALDKIGEAYFFRGHQVTAEESDYDMALAHFQQALKRYETTPDERGICDVLFHIGRSYQNRGEHEKALPFFKQAFELAERQQYLLRKAELLSHFGILALVKGDQEMARQHAIDVLTIREEIGARIELAFSHLTLAEVYHTQGDLGTALHHYQQSYELGEQMQVRNAASAALMGMGYLCLDEGQLQQVQAYFDKAYAVAEAIGLRTGMQEAHEGRE